MNLMRFAKRKPNKLFLFYFLSYFLVILVPVILLGISSYQLAYSSIINEIRNGNKNAIQQTGTSLDRLLDEIKTLSIQLGLDGRIYATSRNAVSSYLLNDVKDRISSLSKEHGYIHSIQIYFNDNGTILSSDGPNRHMPGQPIDQWISQVTADKKSILWLPTRTFVNQDGNPYSIATVVAKLPVAFPEITGYIAIHFKEESLNAYLRGVDSENNTRVYLVAENGALVSAFDKDSDSRAVSAELAKRFQTAREGSSVMHIEGAASLVTIGSPLNNGWKLISVTPLAYVDHKMSYIRNVILLIGLLLVLLGTFFSFFLSRTIYNPIKLVLERTSRLHKELSLPDTMEKEHSLRDVPEIFDQVYLSHKKLEASYKAIYPVMVNRFLNDLFHNRIHESLQDVERKLADLRLPKLTRGFMVMLVEIDDYSKWKERYSSHDLSLLRYAALNIAHEKASEQFTCLSAETGDNQLAILLNTGTLMESLVDMLTETAKSVIHSILAYLPFTVTISFGTATDDLLQVHVSYQKAQEVMRRKILQKEMAILFPDTTLHPQTFKYFYPAHIEKSLANNMRAGNDREALLCLERMREQLLDKPNLSSENVIRLYNRLIETMIDLIEDIGSSWETAYGSGNVFQDLSKHETIDGLHDWISAVCERVCETVRNHVRNPSKADAAIAVIEARYQEDISVEMIADAVQVTPAYLSRIFKQTTGKTVLEYLTVARIEHSKLLLRDTSLTMQEVSRRVGYNNANSFIRFFRKHEGVTPGEYRKINGNLIREVAD
ncbi:helix-turn-helix domain-containing protein [Cohnella candidum]|uniref:AraC family transcriptional regulator n=1 Tax=Cohnella candidum TaxID=2674991 RepID=A0A3G3K3R7_9BACL|nr:helix-turn-helix domain-containing protein [Cohnella candidum]AYQ75156.1 AraC family transcriptional regulator [Cohnella candidum]